LTMIIQSKFKNYNVHIEKDFSFIAGVLALPNTYFVVDRKVYNLYHEQMEDIPDDQIFLIDAIEENKTIETALEICEKMTNIPAKRNAQLVSFGGGIIQDITGFVANILYRGIQWTFVPTTLLAACDSCIGGKTSLNYKRFKNLLGTFYPPDDIYICPAFFRTLSKRDFESGMGEVVKFNIMAGEAGIDNIENRMDALLKKDENELSECVINSLRFKKQFIEEDEFDRGTRIKLNFAHTFGHAIETTTNYEIPHGTAVAIGMIMANHVSFKRKLLNADFVKKSEKVLLQVIHVDPELLEISLDAFLGAMRKDKKQVDDHLTAVLMTKEEDNLRIIHDLQTKEVEDALKYFQNIYAEKQEEIF